MAFWLKCVGAAMDVAVEFPTKEEALEAIVSRGEYHGVEVNHEGVVEDAGYFVKGGSRVGSWSITEV